MTPGDQPNQEFWDLLGDLKKTELGQTLTTLESTVNTADAMLYNANGLFQGIGTTVGQIFSKALAGDITVDDALKQAQEATTREMTKAGYVK